MKLRKKSRDEKYVKRQVRHFKYRVDVSDIDEGILESEAYHWCIENFGINLYNEKLPESYFLLCNSEAIWDHWSDEFYFKNERDAMRFKLIWC